MLSFLTDHKLPRVCFTKIKGIRLNTTAKLQRKDFIWKKIRILYKTKHLQYLICDTLWMFLGPFLALARFSSTVIEN